MNELNFNDEVHVQKFHRPGVGSSIKPEQKLIRKPHKFREIEERLEEQRLQKELRELFY
jgi:hypothetical protein